MRMMPPDEGLKAPARDLSECFSATTVIKETWFPGLLTEKEKQQIAERDAPKGALKKAVLAYLRECDNPVPDASHRRTLRNHMRELVGAPLQSQGLNHEPEHTDRRRQQVHR